MFNRPGSLIVALVIVGLLFYAQQGILASQVSPVFVDAPSCENQFVELSGNLFVCSPHQVVEVTSAKDLLRHVNDEHGTSVLLSYFTCHKLMNGQSVELNRDSGGLATITCEFMSAGRRMTLGVALHPDRMTAEDWRSLPGIGTAMARVITENKEQHGDFCTFEALARVRGIAKKSLDRWRQHF